MEFNLDTVCTVLMLYVLGSIIGCAFLVDKFPKIFGTCITSAFIIIMFAILPIDVATEGSKLYSTHPINSPGLVKDNTGEYRIIIDNVAVRPSSLTNNKIVDIVFVDDDNIDMELRTHKYTEVISFITLWQYQYELVVNKKYMIWDIPRGDY